jgi:NADP-reducing hydrogenase subunit HndB
MKSLEELKKLRDESLKKMNLRYIEGGIRIQIGMGTCGIASGAKPIMKAFLEKIEEKGLKNVVITQVGCMGECALEPMAELIDSDDNHFVYCQMNLSMVDEIVEKHIIGNEPIHRYLLSNRKG